MRRSTWRVLSLSCLILSCLQLVKAQRLERVGAFDFSNLLGIEKNAESAPRVYFSADSQGLVALKLDTTGALLLCSNPRGEEPVVTPVGLRIVSAFLENGDVWVFGRESGSRSGFATEFSRTGQRISSINTGPILMRGAVGPNLLALSSSGALAIVPKSNASSSKATFGKPEHSMGSVLAVFPSDPSRIAVISPESGKLGLVQIRTSQTNIFPVSAPLIERALHYFDSTKQNRDPRLVPAIVTDACVDEDGNILYLLGTVFPDSGGSVLKITPSGELLMQYNFDVLKAFYPRYIASANHNIYVANGRGIGLILNPNFKKGGK